MEKSQDENQANLLEDKEVDLNIEIKAIATEKTPLINRVQPIAIELEEIDNYKQRYGRAPFNFFYDQMCESLDDSNERSNKRNCFQNTMYATCGAIPVFPLVIIAAIPVIAVSSVFGFFAGAIRDCSGAINKNEQSRPESPYF